jgi:hypothetical protein
MDSYRRIDCLPSMHLVAAALCVVMTTGCARQESPAQENLSDADESLPVQATPYQKTAPRRAAPAWLSRIVIGSELRSDGSVMRPDHLFTEGHSIYVTMRVAQRPAKGSIRVEWIAPSGHVRTDDTPRTPSPNVMRFEGGSATDWPQGQYRVRVYVHGKPVHTDSFQVLRTSTIANQVSDLGRATSFGTRAIAQPADEMSAGRCAGMWPGRGASAKFDGMSSVA